VKLDDAGLWLKARGGGAAALGKGLLLGAPLLMKLLGIAGTAAMFLVGGGIIVHGIPGLEAWVTRMAGGGLFPGASFVVPTLVNGLVGVVAGGLILAVVSGVKRALPKKPEPPPAPAA